MSKFERDLALENRTWLQLISMLFLFPLLFFLCVFLPIWLEWAPRFP